MTGCIFCIGCIRKVITCNENVLSGSEYRIAGISSETENAYDFQKKYQDQGRISAASDPDGSITDIKY